MKYLLIAFFMSISCGLHAQFITNQGIEIYNSGLLTVNGDWTNDASSRIINHGVIRTSDAFTNLGVLDESSRGGFHLQFATDLGFQPGGAVMGFLTKDGAGTALVTGNIGVKDSLLLKNGLLRLLNSRDTVLLLGNPVVLAGETAYVDAGLVARTGSGNLMFPLGRDGLYLPLTLHKVHAEKVTASVSSAPAGYTAGPGVDALIDFPYAWQIVEKTAADTAAYVEVNYPTTLPVVANPIVARQVDGNQYASMGARLIENSGTRVTVRSYSRRLNGLFTIAQGFPSDPVTDSLALVALYESTGGTQWTNNTNWLTGTIDTWFGVTVNGQSITAIELPANNLAGPVADPLVDILSLQTINFSANELTAVPDFTLNKEITSLNVSDNRLDFTSLEPNAAVVGINYLTQADIGDPVETEISVGSPYTFAIPQQGMNSQYVWKRNGVVLEGAASATFNLAAISRQTMGEYQAEITHPDFPGLTIKSATQKVLAYADVSGTLFADVDVPATAGELTLFRVQPGAFEPVQVIPVGPSGTYTFSQVVLDDYQIRGFADTLVHERSIPTYYQNTIFWEEADTLKLENHMSALNIVSQVEPGPPSGRGVISGYLQEDDGTGRVTDLERNKRIARAGVSARRVERLGRTKEEILTLVAYVFTDEQGEFTLPNLPAGEYRLNFQYPGYPMDETSYTTIMIGSGLESQVMVEANVIEGKINVQKLVITGLYEADNYHAEVFPNPTVERIHLKFAGEVNGRMIHLMDMQGRLMQSQQADGKEVLVDVNTLTKGIYLLQINESGRKVKVLKISVED